MKKIYFSIIVCLLLANSSLSAQNQVINGRIVDKEQQPIDAAAVILQTVDSIYINAATTDSLGMFRIPSEETNYRLIVQHLLFETKELVFSGKNTGTIIMDEKENLLNEVVIKGERPLVKVVDGKLTYDMERITQGKVVSNAYEAILQLPGVSEQNEAIALAGASKISIILNGKVTTMSNEQLVNLLKNMPVSAIESAEIMYSAPAKYHVRGAAINLVMRNNNSEVPNLQGQVNSAYTQERYANFSSGATLLYATPKLSTDFLYTVNQYKRRSGDNISSFHNLNDSVCAIEQEDRLVHQGWTHNIRTGLDYTVNDKNKLSFVYTGQLTPSFNNEVNSEGNFSNSNNKKEGESWMHNFGLDYTSGFGLKTGLNYTYYKTPATQNFHNLDPEGNATDFTSDSQQKIDRIKLNADQSHQLSNKWELNYGMLFSYAKDHDFQKYTSKEGNDMSALDTDNTIYEYTYNLYAGFSKSFSEKFSMNASLSGEYYQLADFNEWAIYPSAEMTYLFSPKHILQFSLSTNKTYPSYWEVQESVGYLNGYAVLLGNPLLKPYKDYSAQLTYILKQKYMLTAYGSYLPDYFAQLPYQSPQELVLIYQTLNWNYSRSMGLNLIVPFKVGSVLDSRITVNGFNQRVKDDHFHDIAFDRTKWIGYFRLDNTINLSSTPDIKMEVSGFYLTPSMQGIYDLSRVWTVDAGIKWTFANKKAELRLKGTDLFSSLQPDMRINTAGQNLRMTLVPENRSISLSFSYKFGDYKEKSRKKVDTSRFRQE